MVRGLETLRYDSWLFRLNLYVRFASFELKNGFVVRDACSTSTRNIVHILLLMLKPGGG